MLGHLKAHLLPSGQGTHRTAVPPGLMRSLEVSSVTRNHLQVNVPVEPDNRAGLPRAERRMHTHDRAAAERLPSLASGWLLMDHDAAVIADRRYVSAAVSGALPRWGLLQFVCWIVSVSSLASRLSREEGA